MSHVREKILESRTATDAQAIAAIEANYTPAMVERMAKRGKIRKHSVAYMLAKRWDLIA